MPSDAEQLQVLLKSQQTREQRPDISGVVIVEIKESLLFKFNWEQLLQAAPTAINSLGACFAASLSPKAAVQFDPSADGLTKLRYTSVQANLVECANLGRFAFIEAESGMNVIQMASQMMYGKINDVVQCLSDPIAAKKMLRPQLATIKSGSQQCLQASTAMDEKFQTWLAYACEMHAACTQKESTTRDQLQANQVAAAVQQEMLEDKQKSTEEAKKVAEEAAKTAKLASEAFKKASDSFPSGWDLLGQQIVSDLASCVTTALNQATTTLTNPIRLLTPQNRPTTSKPSAPTPSNGALLDPAAADPAFAEVLKISSHMTAMNAIVAGKDDNIDWEGAKGSKENAKSSIQYIAHMLEYFADNFESVATAAEPSTTLKTILKVASQIAAEISAELAKSSGISHQWPEKGSEQVTRWRADFTAQYQKATVLAAAARSLPGSTQMPLMANANPQAQTQQIDPKATHAQAVLDAAKQRLTTTQDALIHTQESYVKTTQMLLEQKSKLAEIQASLARLTAAGVTLTEIKAILIECIKLILNLKQQITSLKRFFNAMFNIVDLAVKIQIDPFLETVSRMVAADSADPNKDVAIGDYTLTDFERSHVYSAAVTIRSYFGVFGDVAKMWMQLSDKSIVPGLHLCDELSVTTSEEDAGEMKKKLADLKRWSDEASVTIAKIAREKQQEILSGMAARIENVKQTTALLEPLPPATRKAIADGTEVTKKAAQQAIEIREQHSSFHRFSKSTILVE